MNNSLIIYSKKYCASGMLTKIFLSKTGLLYEDRNASAHENQPKEWEQMSYNTLPEILFPLQAKWVFAGLASPEVLEKRNTNYKFL